MTEPRPSKSARKREAQTIRAMADELVALKPTLLADIVHDSSLLAAIHEAQRTASHGALRRQKQYIARLMRDSDHEEIRLALEQLDSDPASEKKRFRDAEQLRDALLATSANQRMALLESRHLLMDKTLSSALTRFDRATHDRLRKEASRSVFRWCHDALGAKSR